MGYFNGFKIKIAIVVGLVIVAGLGIYFSRFFPSTAKTADKNESFLPVSEDRKNDSPAVAGEVSPLTETKPESGQVTKAPAVNGDPEKAIPAGANAETKAAETKTEEPKTAAAVVPTPSMETERFVVALGANGVDQVSDDLVAQGFIADKDAFKRALALAVVAAGGYKLSKDMNAEQIAVALRQKPYMKWVVIPEGLRKEEIAVILADALGWPAAQKNKWITTYTQMKADNIEGVYFPDTYLIPGDELPLDVANRLASKFNEKFAVYLPEFSAQNIKWTTGLTLASIVQREAANAGQMPLVAGILWNRLEQGMALNVDATLQYARGDAGNGWWAAIGANDKQIDSPYNTYKNKSLPPHPICNPGIPAIEAVLNPEKTECLYYLHGNDGQIHCAKTYEEHQANIEQYLKSAD